MSQLLIFIMFVIICFTIIALCYITFEIIDLNNKINKEIESEEDKNE